MDEATIRADMQAASDKFNELRAQADQIEVQLQQLQGRYQAYEEQLAKLTASTADPATVIEATPADEGTPVPVKVKK